MAECSGKHVLVSWIGQDRQKVGEKRLEGENAEFETDGCGGLACRCAVLGVSSEITIPFVGCFSDWLVRSIEHCTSIITSSKSRERFFDWLFARITAGNIAVRANQVLSLQMSSLPRWR